MGAYDDAEHPWLTDTKTLLREALRDDVATLAVCLGHQLASVALGGKVARHPAGRQIGVFPLAWTQAVADDPVFALLPGARGVQWNDDVVVEPPPGAVLLAGTPVGGPQVLRLGTRAWSVQFHPEAGYDIVVRWIESDEREGSPRDRDVRAAFFDLKESESELYETWQPVAARFAHQVAER
jgi:GMP synthase (glutamine-hydrolysing)